MSTITVKYTTAVATVITPKLHAIREYLVIATATALAVDPNGVIVDFDPWGEPAPPQAPDVLLRAETSTRRQDLLTPWGNELVQAWQRAVAELDLPLKDIRVAAKPYVIDSAWIELPRD